VVMVLVMIVGIRDPLKLFAKQRQLMKLILWDIERRHRWHRFFES
jgi:hypothetical protein